MLCFLVCIQYNTWKHKSSEKQAVCLHCLGLVKLSVRVGTVTHQCVRVGEVVRGLHDAHVHIIYPVRDVTHVTK